MAANGVKEVIYPPPFGTAIVLRFAWFSELMSIAQRIVDAVNYRGILMIELIRDQKDDQWKVIELNLRHWLFNGFYRRLGFNFTKQLYDDLCESAAPSAAIVASDELQSDNHAHIDLAGIAQKMVVQKVTPSLANFLTALDAIPGNLSHPYSDPGDPAPGTAVIDALANTYGWNRHEALDGISNRLVQDV